ncbi:hypothetical protein HNQ07_003239 [Deinococcus metalli]|uniref:Uncharacterized protein n=1 Tax=Deinococcus metalli TaxID=1141878 RepID=A0A7W8KGL7_9DEIO|nr:hypothetical protein [Deinococcus metalli]MBB5377740.1 hypothetical protein [Deinococcus metalli]GHF52983.1 hypothetical protein GCM10017781_31690 [Deinococcus metalli]
MKRLSVVLLALGSAVAQTSATPTWADLLRPTVEARQQACDAATAYEKAHPTPAGQKYASGDPSEAGRVGRKLTDDRSSPPEVKVPAGVASRVIFELPAGTVGNICANAAREGRPVKITRYSGTTQVYIQGELVALKDALKVTAALRLLDAGGRELARIDSRRDAAAKVDQGLWTRECQDNVCRWRGFSVFEFSDYDIRPETHAATQGVQLVFDRGYGPETRDYTAADFTRLSLGGK